MAFRQLEELFCDLLGLRIFGDGFLYSFLYVLSPNLGDRAPHYPALARRIETLKSGSAKFGVDLPPDYDTYFSEPSAQLSTTESFIVRMADEACALLVDGLIESVERHVASAAINVPSNAERDRIAKQFASLSPASNARSLADIINAGWQMRLGLTCWSDFCFSEATAVMVLNDLVFKTIEVLEYETRVKSEATRCLV